MNAISYPSIPVDRDLRPLTEAEERVLDAVAEAYEGLRAMGLNYNIEEIVAAVHTLQNCVQQHVLHRVFPEAWSDWFDAAQYDPKDTTDQLPYDGNAAKLWEKRYLTLVRTVKAASAFDGIDSDAIFATADSLFAEQSDRTRNG